MKNVLKNIALLILIAISATSCSEDYLKEIPLDRFSPQNLLTNQSGYDAAVVALGIFWNHVTTIVQHREHYERVIRRIGQLPQSRKDAVALHEVFDSFHRAHLRKKFFTVFHSEV
jgi:hypothetical protein